MEEIFGTLTSFHKRKERAADIQSGYTAQIPPATRYSNQSGQVPLQEYSGTMTPGYENGQLYKTYTQL